MWAFRRRLIIIFVVLVFCVLVVGAVFAFQVITEQPLCTDNKQNGSETGIDCGGVCARVCYSETRPLFVNWARVVSVTDKVFSVALEVENRNYDALAHRVEYRCDLMTEDFRTVQQVTDTVSVPPSGRYRFAITGLRFSSVDIRPTRAQCVFNSRHEWLRLPAKTTPSPFDVHSEILVSDERPSLSAVIVNTDNIRTFKNMSVIAVVFDKLDTVVSVSSTSIDRLEPVKSKDLVFTWPSPFTGVGPYRAELTPVFDFPDYAREVR
jgi:hypothetical protein